MAPSELDTAFSLFHGGMSGARPFPAEVMALSRDSRHTQRVPSPSSPDAFRYQSEGRVPRRTHTLLSVVSGRTLHTLRPSVPSEAPLQGLAWQVTSADVKMAQKLDVHDCQRTRRGMRTCHLYLSLSPSLHTSCETRRVFECSTSVFIHQI